MDRPIQVFSEIGKLKQVLLKRPGQEINNLVPDYLARLLFDDIPFLPVLQKEHDGFAKALRDEGVEVLYLEHLTAEALDAGEGLREQFVDDILNESGETLSGHEQGIREHLLSLTTPDLVNSIMSGLRKNEIDIGARHSLQDMMESRYPFYLDPMPNLYFTRDPAASIGHGFTINRMAQSARRRESLFMQYILKNHPNYAGKDVPIWLDRNTYYRIEGGDEHVLAKDCIAVGVSERTSAPAIENLARNLFARQDEIRKVLAIEIPETRAFMHLDTVFTMVNYAQFTIHPAIRKATTGDINVYIFEPDEKEEGGFTITKRTDFENVLKEVLGESEIDLIPCGGGDEITAAREQWNDGSNTLAIAPGVVITYDRNVSSNELMREHGIRVIEVVGSELVRGRGGPRCMSMPFYREDI